MKGRTSPRSHRGSYVYGQDLNLQYAAEAIRLTYLGVGLALGLRGSAQVALKHVCRARHSRGNGGRARSGSNCHRGIEAYGNDISSHRPSSFRAHISGQGFVLGFSGRGVSLTISPVSRSVQVLPAAFCIEPSGQGLALADPEAEADAEDVTSGPEVTRPQSTSKVSKMCCMALRSASLTILAPNTTTHSRPSGAAATE